MTPVERHAAALNAINQQIEDARKLIVEAQRVQLALDEPRMLGRYMPGWHSWKDIEKALAAAVKRLEGCRRILARTSGIKEPRHPRNRANRP